MKIFRLISVGDIISKIKYIDDYTERYYKASGYVTIGISMHVSTILSQHIYFSWSNSDKDWSYIDNQLCELPKMELFEIYTKLSQINLPVILYEEKKNFINGIDRISGKTFPKIPRNVSSQHFRNHRIKH